MSLLPPPKQTVIGLVHPYYHLREVIDRVLPGLDLREARTAADIDAIVGDCHVLVQASVLWRPELIARAQDLRFIQSISAGIEHYDLDALRVRGIKLANAARLYDQPVAEHVFALLLALTRRIPDAVRHQSNAAWRKPTDGHVYRETELGGKTMLIVGLGNIGQRVAQIAKAIDMHVIGVRADPSKGAGAADDVRAVSALHDVIGGADVLVLAAPLTAQTHGMIDAVMLGHMKRDSILINVARGGLVEEAALVGSLRFGPLAAAGLDCFAVEPLPASSPLWSMPNVLITSHSAGQSSQLETRLAALLVDNLERLWRGEHALKNEIV